MQLKVNIVGLFLISVFIGCGLFESNDNGSALDKVYVALQGVDQVGIVDINSGEIDIVDINYLPLSCMRYTSIMDCSMASGCEWMEMGSMSHCMNAVDACLDLDETQCIEMDGCNILYLESISINLNVDLERNPCFLDFLK